MSLGVSEPGHPSGPLDGPEAACTVEAMRTDIQLQLLRQRIDWLLADEDINEAAAAVLMSNVALISAALDEDLADRRARPPS